MLLFTERMIFNVPIHAQSVNSESECVLTAWATNLQHANHHRIKIIVMVVFHR